MTVSWLSLVTATAKRLLREYSGDSYYDCKLFADGRVEVRTMSHDGKITKHHGHLVGNKLRLFGVHRVIEPENV